MSDLEWDVKIGTLSGGQRRRVDLARVLIGDYDVLMMDEPTNHLDIEGIHWLAEHLKSRWRDSEGALLLVTHDRWFLDEVCLDMWEVHDRVVTPFEGGYSAYIMQRVERQRQARVAEAKRKNILRRELAWLARGAPARSTKPRFRVEAAEALIADEPPLRKKVELRRTAMSRLGKKVIHIRDARRSSTRSSGTSGRGSASRFWAPMARARRRCSSSSRASCIPLTGASRLARR